MQQFQWTHLKQARCDLLHPAQADNATLVFVAEKDGKLRVNYQGWAEVKVILSGEQLEIVTSGGQVHVYRRGEPLTDPYREWDGTMREQAQDRLTYGAGGARLP
jgi:hypothetical protein